jgi:D-glycero-D-manno-heptose 1,7-bisphosphate phosphatase
VVGRAAVFVDRDGVINRAFVRDGKPYPPRHVSEFEILADAPGAFARLRAAGFALVVATNQPDVSAGLQSRETVEAMHAILARALAPDAIKVCWDRHAPCYKPKTGMLVEAAHEFGLDLTASWMVGDRWRDVDCGKAAGCRTIFVDRGYAERLSHPPDYVCAGLGGAADIILAAAR